MLLPGDCLCQMQQGELTAYHRELANAMIQAQPIQLLLA